MFILLLPLLNTLASVMVICGVSITVLFLILSFPLALTVIATNLLKGQGSKDLIAYNAFAGFRHLHRPCIALFGGSFMVTAFAKCNEVIHAVITVHTSRDFMMYIKRSSVLFRRLTAMLANFVTDAHSLRDFFPSFTIIDTATAIVPMVLTYQPFTHVRWIDKEHIGFTILNAEARQFKRFTASAGAFNVNILFSVGFANLFLSFIRVMLAIKVVMLSKFDSLFACFRTASSQTSSKRWSKLKDLIADGADFLYTRLFMCWHNGIILSSQDSSSIFVGRLVTKPALSAGDQPTQASLIISSFGGLVKRKEVTAP